jgi:hypothetical protein
MRRIDFDGSDRRQWRQIKPFELDIIRRCGQRDCASELTNRSCYDFGMCGECKLAYCHPIRINACPERWLTVTTG